MTKRSLAELSAAAKRRVLFCAASAVVALGGLLRPGMWSCRVSLVVEASRSVLLVTGSLLCMQARTRSAWPTCSCTRPTTRCVAALHACAHALRVHLQHHVIGSSTACLHSLCTIHIHLPGAGRGTHHVDGHGGPPARSVLGF